jgi:hypothetical protein
MFDLSPMLLWSEEKLCSWAVSPCLRNTQQRRAWRKTGERVENKEHPTIGDTALQVKLNGSPDGCDQ